MARPLLDTSPLRSAIGPSRSGVAAGIQQAGRGLAAGIQGFQKEKKEEEEKFKTALDFDISEVSNDAGRQYAGKQWKVLEEKWKKKFADKGILKTGLSMDDQIAMQGDLRNFQKEVEGINMIQKQYDAAKQAAAKDARITVNEEAFNNWTNALLQGDQDGINSFSKDFYSTNAGLPGTMKVDFSPDDYFVENAPRIKKMLKESGVAKETGTGVRKYWEGGDEYEEKWVDWDYGDKETWVNAMLDQAKNPKYEVVSNLDNWVMKNLTDEEKKEAYLTYGDDPGSLTRHYMLNKMPDEQWAEFTGSHRDYAHAARIRRPQATGTKESSASKNKRNYLTAEGRPLKTAFGIESDNYVDWSGAPNTIRTLNDLFLDKGTKEIYLKDGKSQVRESEKAGTSQNYQIAGHDRDRGVFYLTDVKARKQDTDDAWGAAKGEESHMIMVPEEIVMQALTGKKPSEDMLSSPTKDIPKTQQEQFDDHFRELVDEGYTTKQIQKAAFRLFKKKISPTREAIMREVRGEAHPTAEGGEEQTAAAQGEQQTKFVGVPEGGF